MPSRARPNWTLCGSRAATMTVFDVSDLFFYLTTRVGQPALDTRTTPRSLRQHRITPATSGSSAWYQVRIEDVTQLALHGASDTADCFHRIAWTSLRMGSRQAVLEKRKRWSRTQTARIWSIDGEELLERTVTVIKSAWIVRR